MDGELPSRSSPSDGVCVFEYRFGLVDRERSARARLFVAMHAACTIFGTFLCMRRMCGL